MTSVVTYPMRRSFRLNGETVPKYNTAEKPQREKLQLPSPDCTESGNPIHVVKTTDTMLPLRRSRRTVAPTVEQLAMFLPECHTLPNKKARQIESETVKPTRERRGRAPKTSKSMPIPSSSMLGHIDKDVKHIFATPLSEESLKVVKAISGTSDSMTSPTETVVATKNKSVDAKVEATIESTLDIGLTRSYEERALRDGYKIVAGVDEAGRGPLAGPVVAAACIVPPDVQIRGLDDSKKLKEADRERIFDILTKDERVIYAVKVVDAKRIDEINILQASLEAMRLAVEDLCESPEYVFVDGNRLPQPLKMPAEFVIKGDSKVFSIAAASVIAKVTRDRIMLEYDKTWPEYQFASHKGYPTRTHVAALYKHGPCDIHRLTYAPLKNWDSTQLSKSRGKKQNREEKRIGKLDQAEPAQVPVTTRSKRSERAQCRSFVAGKASIARGNDDKDDKQGNPKPRRSSRKKREN